MSYRVQLAIVGGVASALATGAALAQNYPNRLVRMVVTYPAGGSSDTMGRILAQKMTELWGQQVIVEPKAGAAGAIGMDHTLRQPADGYTMVIGNIGPAAVNPLLTKVSYDVLKDFVSAGMISTAPNILVVNPQSPIKSVQDLAAMSKAQPGKLTYGSSGSGSLSHLAAEMFKRMTGGDITQVPYKGGVQWATDLIGGQINMVFADALPVFGHARSGRLKALAVTSDKRFSLMPDVGTLAEQGVPGFHAVNWWGILFPAGTPRPIIEKVNADLVKIIAMKDFHDKYADLGLDAVSSTPEFFRAHIVAEMEKWGKLIREANLKAE